MQTHELQFLKPGDHTGLTTTVRRGDKWLKQARIGDRVEIKEAGTNHVLRTAQITGLLYLPFDQLPDAIIRLQHSRETEDRAGLLKAMERAYPGFQPSEDVTVVFYQ